MALRSPLDPTPSLAGGDFKPSSAVAAPQVNSVDKPYTNTVAPYVGQKTPDQPDWLILARNAYEASESWMQTNIRSQWARNFAHYRSEHAPNSPILSERNRHRSRYFYPKSRTLVRDIQAAIAEAYFASSDVVNIEAEDNDDPNQVAAALLMKELVNYRCTQTIPWYLTLLGGGQEAAVLGTVVSHQSWEYKEVDGPLIKEEIDPNTGMTVQYYEPKVIKDKPKIRIIPAENIRMSPASDWADPANDSPYLIELMPLFLGDVLTKIKEGENSKTGEPNWRNIGASALLSAANRDNLDTTRRARSGDRRLDPKSNMMEVNDEFRSIWIHRNIIRHDGIDYLYYSAGTNILLSDPVPLSEVIPWANNKRDYIIGKMEIETDRPYPSGPVELAAGMQSAYNELKNQRFDNVRQVLNRRYLYRQGNSVDIRSLSNNIPGGLIGISAPGALDSHVAPLPVQDVTASAYQEEDRLGLTFDDLTGLNSGATANSNRKLQETATGMNLMADAGNRIRSMELRTLTETWVKPMIQQLIQLEAYYETDVTALTVSAKKAGLLQILPQYFDYRFTASVNVGMGAVSPTQKIQRIQTAVATVTQLVPDAAMAINGEEVTKEVFGAAGFDNGSRFFDWGKAEQAKQNPPQDPKAQIAAQQMQLKQQTDQATMQLKQQELQLKMQEMRYKMQEMQHKMQIADLESQAKVRLTDAQATTQSVQAIYEGTQAAALIAQNPGSPPVTDGILASAGFKDRNQAPIVPEVTPQEAAEIQPTQPVTYDNTHPNVPATGKAGIMRGIETPK